MKMRKVFLGVAALALMPTLAAAEEVVLKVAHFLPPVSPAHTKFIQPWCDKIEAESKGKMKCQIYPAMQLGGTPPQLLNQVRDGVADIVWTLPGYTPGRFPVSEVFELPFMTTTHEASSRAFWDFSQKYAQKEFAGTHPIAVWVNGPNVLHFRDKQVKTLDDLKGVKVRAPSRLGNSLLAALGATPVGMPVPQMAESLSKGVIDGALIPWEVVPATKTHELTKFHAEAGSGNAMTTATMIFVMNKKKYDGLPADLKKVIDDNSGRETSAWVSAQFKDADAGGRAKTEANGNTIYQIDAAEMAKWQAAARPVTEEWIKDISEKGLNGKQLYEDAAALVKQYSK
ncbi:TRAP transporter substrate-binding protein [Azoarcus sp. L1K30]|uniref:TRAP transporter substrate-binding protein n=1 Tax=Azoarcus sp. L1K30 TaxID=2820277 RepID=UPI001B81EFE4|nr:TRAP transporter substrate-binding protein [Azoarcus sp. L1K30]MBR0564748.1 TRAP transporter substrate-binding protein [Azoarcus sp. L1K30]